ncbi:hypothetical protein [Actinomadura mexicana]|uniref:Uncharacterized protein n=1 Tax=Actinomadura mexicana TaxID=134959 RepID=A0A239CVX7_9ACTN|nr:hypothetical protein [Actinomadura mexicana]SNS23811.1 hypothetical protein SAMN06265355_113122 [Actinomadura mexicana]
MRHENYGRLLRLAYLTLDDGDHPLSRARRAVARAMRTRRGGYPAMRARLVAILLTDPPTGRHRLNGLLFEPARIGPGPVRAALLEFPRHERLAYLLGRDGLTAPETVAELSVHVPVDFGDVDRIIGAVDDRTGMDEVAQRAEIEAFDPDLVRLRPPPAVPPAGRAAVAGVVAVVLLAVAGTALTGEDERHGAPALISASTWQASDAPTVDVWPSQGGLLHDAKLLRRAADAWRNDRRDPPLGRVAVLYAGPVDGASLVVLRDSPGPRDTPSVAQYFERRLSRGVESVRKLVTNAGQLVMVGMTWRYLVPPWLRDVRAAVPSGRSPDWQPVAVRDGLTAPLPWQWFTPRCQNYVVFQMTSGTQTVTQLASNDPRSAAPSVWFRDPPERGRRSEWAALNAVACAGAATLSESGDLRLGRLWSGDLPDGGGRATLLTVDASSPSGAPGGSLLISEDGQALSERGGTNSDHASSSWTEAAAVWWRSPRRWHLVAAAGPGVARLKSVGELGSHETAADRRGGAPLLVVPGPRSGAAARLPVVQVVAYEPDGDRTVVTPR